MSADAVPISQDRFAEAIADLPIGNLHAKAAELRNSVAHLMRSNEQLQPFADDGDRECADAMKENQQVLARMVVRIGLLKREMEKRGLSWGNDEHALMNGKSEGQTEQATTSMGIQISTSPDSRLDRQFRSEAELAQTLRELVDGDMPNDDGVHL